MVLSIILLVFLGVVAFFHYVQGGFSATISVIIAVISAALAFSFFEPLEKIFIVSLKFYDASHALALILIFAVSYILLRVIYDKSIPGNIRLPLLMDKVVAGVMGIIAGLIVTGVVAVAFQSLPFGPSIAGYSRYQTVDRPVTYNIGGQGKDGFVYDEMLDDDFKDESVQHLLLRQDDFVVGLATKLSNGSLSGNLPFDAVHPDYLQELFGDRLGVQVGAKHTIYSNTDENPTVKVDGLYMQPGFTQIDDANKNLRKDRKVDAVLKPGEGQTLLVARIEFTDPKADGDDTDGIVRLSCGTVRLCAGGTNYYPVGTLEEGKILYAERIDDPLAINLSSPGGADFVFVVDNDKAFAPATGAKAQTPTMADGSFIEVKHRARIPVEGMTVDYGPTTALKNGVVRRKDVVTAAGKLLPQAGKYPVHEKGGAKSETPAPSAG